MLRCINLFVTMLRRGKLSPVTLATNQSLAQAVGTAGRKADFARIRARQRLCCKRDSFALGNGISRVAAKR